RGPADLAARPGGDVSRRARARAARGDRRVPGNRCARGPGGSDPPAAQERPRGSLLAGAHLGSDVKEASVGGEASVEREASEPGGERDPQRRIVEAVVLSSPDPISAARIAEVLPRCNPSKVRAIVRDLNEEYAARHAAFEIWEVAGGFQMRSLPE